MEKENYLRGLGFILEYYISGADQQQLTILKSRASSIDGSYFAVVLDNKSDTVEFTHYKLNKYPEQPPVSQVRFRGVWENEEQISNIIRWIGADQYLVEETQENAEGEGVEDSSEIN